MSGNALVSLGIFGVLIGGSVLLGLLSMRRRTAGPDFAEWSVGGRSMGTVLIFVLMAGETYTSFSYLGAAGWAYEYGMPVFYLIAYLAIGFAVGYAVGPILWHYAHRNGLHSITDIAAHRFDSPWLGAATALLTTVFLLPYVQLQITGMGVVVSTISYGAVGLGGGYVIAFVVSEAFVIASGLRGSAWVSVLKDGLVVVTLLAVFVYVPVHYFGGLGPMLERVVAERPQWLVLPGQQKPSLDVLWFGSTGLLNGVVYTIFPTTVAGYLGARNPGVLRRNALIMPFYQVLLFVPILLGLAAVFVVPGLGDSNLALFELVVASMPAWAVGLVGVAGALSAIVPMAVFMLVIGTMWGRSILGGVGSEEGVTDAAEGALAAGDVRGGAGGPGADLRLAQQPRAVVGAVLPGIGAAAARRADLAAVEADVARGGGVRAGGRSAGRGGARDDRQRPARGDQRGSRRARGEPGDQHRSQPAASGGRARAAPRGGRARRADGAFGPVLTRPASHVLDIQGTPSISRARVEDISSTWRSPARAARRSFPGDTGSLEVRAWRRRWTGAPRCASGAASRTC